MLQRPKQLLLLLQLLLLQPLMVMSLRQHLLLLLLLLQKLLVSLLLLLLLLLLLQHQLMLLQRLWQELLLLLRLVLHRRAGLVDWRWPHMTLGLAHRTAATYRRHWPSELRGGRLPGASAARALQGRRGRELSVLQRRYTSGGVVARAAASGRSQLQLVHELQLLLEPLMPLLLQPLALLLL